MDRRAWWLAGTVLAVIACAVAALVPGSGPVADAVALVVGLATAAVLWIVGGRRQPGLRGWRLLALGPLFSGLGTVVAFLLHPSDPLQFVVLRWVPMVPGYVIGVVAILTLVERAQLRSGRPRVIVELALFGAACVVTVHMLLLGPDGSLWDLALGERLILGAAVVATSATMAAALTVLGVVEARRRRMALVLLLAAALLTAGRGLGTSAMLSGASEALDAGRALVVCGLALLGLAVLVDPGHRPEPADRRTSAGVFPVLGHVLPHVAMVIAACSVGAVTLFGHRPGAETVAGAVLCVGLAAVHRVVTVREEQRMAVRLRRSEAYFRSVVRSSGDAVVILDDALRISWASSALERALGSAAADLVGRPLLEAVHPEDVAALAAALPTAPVPDPVPAGAPDGDDGADGVAPAGLLLLRLRDAAGAWCYLEAGVSDLRRVPDVGAVVLHCRDMTERHAREQALQSVAYTDPMTGLPNRAGMLRALQGAASDAGQATRSFLLIELDGLSAARENAGRETVSTVVAEVGRRLRATVRADDVVARMGGGAFAVLAEGDDCDAGRLADRCLSVVEQPIPTPAGIVDLTAGIGLVPVGNGLTVEELLRRADLAVRAAHQNGPGSAVRYSSALGEAAARRDQLRNDLHGARDRGELFLLFQPIVSLTEQRITGVEAQLRWRHPGLGEVLPAEFVPIAERAGLIGDLMRWALVEAATAAAGLPESGPPLRVGIRLPDGYVAGGTVVADVEQALSASALAAERLVLQVGAATVMSGDERTGLDLSTVRLMGVHVALVGFGSGDSALAHLTRQPIDIVHLDRALISRVDRDRQSRALCESVVGIVRSLGLDVVADGVETPAQLAALCGFGCGFAQGFLIARPGPLPTLAAMLSDGAGSLWPGLVGSQ